MNTYNEHHITSLYHSSHYASSSVRCKSMAHVRGLPRFYKSNSVYLLISDLRTSGAYQILCKYP